MIIELKFPFPPLSQNNIERTGSRTNLRYKTKEALEYKNEMQCVLIKNRDRIKSLIDSFCPDDHGIDIEFWWHIDEKLCLTKRKNKASTRRLSKRGGDYDNYIKYTQDVFFDYMNVNDFFIISARQFKVPVKGKSFFTIKIMIEPLALNPYYREFI